MGRMARMQTGRAVTEPLLHRLPAPVPTLRWDSVTPVTWLIEVPAAIMAVIKAMIRAIRVMRVAAKLPRANVAAVVAAARPVVAVRAASPTRVAVVRLVKKVSGKRMLASREAPATDTASALAITLSTAQINRLGNARCVTSFIAIGGNLGDALATVTQAMNDVAHMPHTELVRRSSLYRTAPLDSTGPDFINAVIEISTQLDAHALLRELQALEQAAGRTRPHRNAPRTLDLDILLYDDKLINTATLTVPHPRMMQRAFVLAPLAEIAPQRVSALALQAVHSQPVNRIEAVFRASS